jgi:hypothetical protein
MAGKTHSQKTILGIASSLDLDGFYQDALVEFADNYGWTRGQVCYWWSEIVKSRQECGQDQEIAEDAALHDVFDAFRNLKIGTEPD